MLQGGKMKWLQFHALSLKALNNLSKKEEIIKKLTVFISESDTKHYCNLYQTESKI